jgi:hypothetical protein
MNFTQTINNRTTSYAYRPTLSTLSWAVSGPSMQAAGPSGLYGGTITDNGVSGSTSDAYTMANPPGSPASGGYVDGEMVLGQISSTGGNTGLSPTLQLTGRTGAPAAPILDSSATGMRLGLGGASGPSAGATVSLVFAGSTLTSAHTLHYTAVSGDTNLSTFRNNLHSAINADTTLQAANIVATNDAVSTVLDMRFNPNVVCNPTCTASLGAGMTIAGSDNAGLGTTYATGTLPIDYLPNSAYTAFTYSSLAGGWIAVPNVSNGTVIPASGLPEGPPLEFLEEWVNRANVGMWYNVDILYGSGSITSLVTNIANSGVKELVLEFSNETWNPITGEYFLSLAMGDKLGFNLSGDVNQSMNAFYGLRLAQMAKIARAAWGAAGRSQAQLFISDGDQFTNVDVTNRLNGTSLNPASNVTMAAYGGYGATSVSTNYSAFPSRPVDNADFLSIAPYFVGGELNAAFGCGLDTFSDGSCQSTGTPYTISNYNCLLVASYNYANGNSTAQQNAINFLYSGGPSGTGDAYNGQLNGSYPANGAYSLGAWAHGSGVSGADYFGITTQVAAYDSVRTGTNPNTGLTWNKLGVAAYEGDWQAQPNFSGDTSSIVTSLNNLGDSAGYTSGLTAGPYCGLSLVSGGPGSTVSGDANNILALHVAFKNSTNFRDLYLRYFNDFNNAINSQGTRISLPATYGFVGTSATANTDQWSKFPYSVYTTPYASWIAIQQFDN